MLGVACVKSMSGLFIDCPAAGLFAPAEPIPAAEASSVALPVPDLEVNRDEMPHIPHHIWAIRSASALVVRSNYTVAVNVGATCCRNALFERSVPELLSRGKLGSDAPIVNFGKRKSFRRRSEETEKVNCRPPHKWPKDEKVEWRPTGKMFRNRQNSPSLLGMPRYFFHLVGGASAHDRVGHDCKNDTQAKEDARLIAQRLSMGKPEMFRGGNFISVTNDEGNEIFHVPLAYTTA